MARIVMCGWESGSPNEFGVLSYFGNTNQEACVAGRNGEYGWKAQNYRKCYENAYLLRSVPLQSQPSEIWVRFAIGYIVHPTAMGGTTAVLFDLMDGSTVQLALGILGPDPTIRLFRGATQIDSGGAFPMGAPYVCIEMHVIIHSSAGVATVWVNGQQVINFTGNTQASALARLTDARFGFRNVNNPSWGETQADIAHYDDIAINDTTGSVNNGRIGQGGIVALRPTADTGEKDWTPSIGVDNFARVNSAPPLGDASYVSTANSGDLDLYELPNLSGGEIDAVAAMAVSRVASGTGRALAPTLRSGAVTAIGSTFLLTNTYAVQQQIYETDPNTGAAWTLTAVNSVQCGMTIVS